MWCNAASVPTWICTNKPGLSSKKREVKYHNCRTCQRIIVFVCVSVRRMRGGGWRGERRTELQLRRAAKDKLREPTCCTRWVSVFLLIGFWYMHKVGVSNIWHLGPKWPTKRSIFGLLTGLQIFFELHFFFHEGLFCKSLTTDCVFETGCLRC